MANPELNLCEAVSGFMFPICEHCYISMQKYLLGSQVLGLSPLRMSIVILKEICISAEILLALVVLSERYYDC